MVGYGTILIVGIAIMFVGALLTGYMFGYNTAWEDAHEEIGDG